MQMSQKTSLKCKNILTGLFASIATEKNTDLLGNEEKMRECGLLSSSIALRYSELFFH